MSKRSFEMDSHSGTIAVIVNGEEKQVAGEATLADVLTEFGLDPDAARGVAIAVNDEVVRRALWKETAVNEKDRVEIVTAQQGG